MLSVQRWKLSICMLILSLILGCTSTQFQTIGPVSNVGLAPGMKIGVVATTLGGLVPRDRVNPDEVGEGLLITVQDVRPGESITVSWRRTIERAVPSEGPTPVVGVGTPRPTPRTEIVTEEGTIAATGLDDAHAVLLPVYWQDTGLVTTDTSLMWLSQQAFEQLKRTQRTRWSADALTAFTNLPVQAIEQINEASKDRELYLAAEPDVVDFNVAIDGRKSQLQAIRAFDDFGNEYLILDQAENPMIVRFRLNVVSTGVIGIDVGIWVLIKAIFSGYQVVEISQ